MTRHSCPACGPIPDDEVLGVQIDGVYDGVLFWVHLTCGAPWNRWDPVLDGRRHAAAREHIARWLTTPPATTTAASTAEKEA